MTTRARDAAYEARVRASFSRQALMHTLGAQLETVLPGEVVITLPFRADLTQQPRKTCTSASVFISGMSWLRTVTSWVTP